MIKGKNNEISPIRPAFFLTDVKGGGNYLI